VKIHIQNKQRIVNMLIMIWDYSKHAVKLNMALEITNMLHYKALLQATRDIKSNIASTFHVPLGRSNLV
jgi:hypothetical protein